MKVLMISTDRKIFEENSAVRQRMVEYGNMTEGLHIIVLSKKVNFERRLLGGNVSVYPTSSRNKFFYIFDAIRIGRKIVNKNNLERGRWLVTTQDPFETGLIGWVIAKTRKAKLQLQIHTDFMSSSFQMASPLNKNRSQLAMFLITQADGIRVVSERIKDSITKFKPPTPFLLLCKTLKPIIYFKYKLSRNSNSFEAYMESYRRKGCGGKLKKDAKISILPIFVDVKKIKETQSTFSLRDKYRQFDFIILMASRLEKEKNIPLAIDLMKDIVENYPKVGLVIVGDGLERDRLQRKVSKNKLMSNVIFEGWQNDLISYYKSADLFLSTSNYEGYGMTLIETASSGCPVLATDVGLVGDVLREESIGICKVGDKKCFLKKLKEILNNKSILITMSENAKKDIEKRTTSSQEEYLSEFKKGWEVCFE